MPSLEARAFGLGALDQLNLGAYVGGRGQALAPLLEGSPALAKLSACAASAVRIPFFASPGARYVPTSGRRSGRGKGSP
jgi:hypothetical protein